MWILASNSARRKQLMDRAGWKFSVLAAEIDEKVEAEETPAAYVLRLAENKARTIAALAPTDAVIIAADTTVAAPAEDGKQEILGKPSSPAEAEAMLRRLRGQSHQVYTALAVLRVEEDSLRSDVCVTQVRMRNYSGEEIRAYIASGDPFDKAGGYAIQHPGFHPAEGLEGCYANVMGLPVCRLASLLEQVGVLAKAEIDPACQEESGFQCKFYERS